jgi:TRAP-type C4-dicarboxylate transport system permease small subunit
MGLKSKIDKVSEFFLKVNSFICLLLPVIIIIVAVIRAISPKGIPIWSIELCELLMWFLTYLATGFILRMGRHITVDIVVSFLKPQPKRIVGIVMMTIILVMSVILLIGGFDASWSAWMVQKKTSNNFPEYIFSAAIPLGLAFLVYEALFLLLKRFSSGEPAEPTGHCH